MCGLTEFCAPWTLFFLSFAPGGSEDSDDLAGTECPNPLWIYKIQRMHCARTEGAQAPAFTFFSLVIKLPAQNEGGTPVRMLSLFCHFNVLKKKGRVPQGLFNNGVLINYLKKKIEPQAHL